ncbi:7,8-didemethyl-8-hydroxy-5-deazariboflavin synthase CofG [Aeromicrobium duanguangcaii]|uniref:7,8-didemethyl-8-hydroxy-5-deazariboflavin synthase n=1 Tax=Aeromicrobium duanguangcaii TaxID=2968086 RepID=A0ABY5KHV0_9ACTN|nr:7,8-didemethyl-8-hydroxy-5-deazariboflavin synthase CofG [Aeromicrobium duanguangcaii]MCD9154643.1 7,8-didemethyl-8-hydroxy-5-deazariboflavin synthase CofG [Aeromicrobium duanguangcaii]UUI67943.1 7,8-didemethyl-8-hydroxy-5-deazariboflavin synthase CofG [Aeromicrobium duanguangcaii]
MSLQASEVSASMLSARGDDLDDLVRQAGRIRDEGLARAGRPGVITWSRKVFVPVTTLCRDRCHYCVFVDTPGKLERKGIAPYLSEEHVLAIAHQGAALGCKEALLTLGDRPEDRWDVAREWLDEHGFASTLDYVGHLARRITEETGLLAHLNPGVMTAAELERLRPTAPSMGMMLETTSHRLFAEPGQAHFGSPDKDPALRLQVLEDAGRLKIPFTTGLLIGIGETFEERFDSILALRDVSERHGHVQEVIIQNFRAKPATAMQGVADAETDAYIAAVAATRIVLGPDARIQAPPNLSDPGELALLIAAGIDDWGGVSPLTADHVNPERPWPQVDQLTELTRAASYALRERLTVHPHYIRDRDAWIDPALHESVLAFADADGLAAVDERAPRTTGAAPRDLFAKAEQDPAGLSDDEYERLMTATGADLDRLTGLADELRRSVAGATVSLVQNRNLGSDRVTDPDLVAQVAADAVDLGATELCIQGTADPDTPDDVYEQMLRAARAAAPELHLHAFRPADVIDGARRTGRTIAEQYAALAAAGVDTVPGTGVKVLDEAYRAEHFPADLPVDQWEEAIRAAHGLGLHSTSVLFYGHGESPLQRVRHLRRLRAIQTDTGGFNELVPMAFPGGDHNDDQHRAVHAVARLILHGSINHVQAAWTRLGVEGAILVLRSGADDLGGTLYDGRVLPEAGVEFGQELTVEAAGRIAKTLGRQLRLRTTTYGVAP